MSTKDGKKIGLALSGGGYRAAGFHLGVLKELHKLNVLGNIDIISTVSGGSIIGSFYVQNYAQKYINASQKDKNDVFNNFEQAFIKILKTNFVHKTLLRLARPDNLLHTISPDYSRTDVAAEVYEELLFSDCGKFLNDLPDKPQLIINATNMNNGKIWKFTKSWMGSKPDYLVGLDEFTKYKIADAVAASAAFPVGFPPIEIELEEFFVDKGRGEIKLQDGGIIDNIGLTSILESDEKCSFIIASDGGAPFKIKEDVSGRATNVLHRVIDILQEQARQLSMVKVLNEKLSPTSCVEEVGMLIIDQKHGLGPDNTWSDLKIRKVASIKTDLRDFDDRTIRLLMDRGSFLTNRRLTKHMTKLLASV
jgi:NTE family protein